MPAPSDGHPPGAQPDPRRHRREPYAVFRPRRGRVVATVMAAVSIVVFTVAAIVVPSAGDVSAGGWTPAERGVLALVGLILAFGLMRFARLRAVPSSQGLVVHNVMTTRRLEWAQILSVQFSGGAPWVMLELDDTDVVAVMAIQRSDGPYADREASRLSALVQHHSTAPEGPY
ncbi:MAG TPA: PH domain-containing protein [Segeticoccus sp.]|uniref:PH domain-containing protein n=1 Tax=Segeticoccus sp. TaxID=2706531 RepID=UPI002D7F218E|nr:PH domain-containing protein [Segeticoccus sp.]HET8600650.1 PH domain-containing protein [Segeticoccus sp.]